MSTILLVVVGVGVLTGISLGVLAVLIAAIRRGDRDHFTSAPSSHADAITRRLLVGVRYPSGDNEGEDQ